MISIIYYIYHLSFMSIIYYSSYLLLSLYHYLLYLLSVTYIYHLSIIFIILSVYLSTYHLSISSSTLTEERPCEDRARRQSSLNLGEISQKNLTLLAA